MGDTRTHLWLTTGMARAVGVDMPAAMREGLLSQSDYADMVTSCRKCGFAAGCKAWLDRQWGDPVAAPEQCQNRNMWSWLARSGVQG